MQNCSSFTRWLLVLLCIAALSGAAFATGTEEPLSPKSEAVSLGALASAQHGDADSDDALLRIKAKTYPRAVAWWPHLSGPYYGDSPAYRDRSPDTLKTLVGSFRIGESLNIPAELTNGLDGLAVGRKQHFLVQLRPSALDQPFREVLESEGAEIVGSLPVNGMILRLDQAAYNAVSGSPLIQYIAPYHAAYKIEPHVGRMPQATVEEAASPMFKLKIRLFEGEDGAVTAAALQQLGVEILGVTEPEPAGARIYARAHASLVTQIAKLESVFTIAELSPQMLHGDRGARFVQNNTDSLRLTFWRANLDGDGQVVHVTDSGLSPDAGDFSDTRPDAIKGATAWPPFAKDPASGFDADGCANAIPPNGDDRKIICYQHADEYTSGEGDFYGCDSLVSGFFTHGQLVTGVAAGNATRGQMPPVVGTEPAPDDNSNTAEQQEDRANTYCRDTNGNSILCDAGDTVIVYDANNNSGPDDGGFFIDTISGEQGAFSEADNSFDGVAKGARVVFTDAAVNTNPATTTEDCPDGPFIPSGDITQNITQPWNNFNANIHNFSFGSGDPTIGPVYIAGADDIDAAILAEPIQFVAESAGNDGSVSENNLTPGCADTPGTLGNEASCKNCVSVGASNGYGSVWSFTSQGPATTNGRILPLLLAEGLDNACRSEDPGGVEDQTGEATCFDQSAGGTSFASPNVAGAAAIIQQYFADGYYPTGSTLAANRVTTGGPNLRGVKGTRVPLISSALTKAIMICSTQGGESDAGSDAGVVWPEFGRFNTVTGYGQIFLNRGLPLADFPETISGLVVYDQDNRDGNVGIQAPLPTLGFTSPFSGTDTQEFDVLGSDEDLVISLVWHDASTSPDIVDDLDLSVRYCGPDQTCGNGDDITWRGNAFGEDANRDCSDSYVDLNGNTEQDGYAYTISDQAITNGGGTPSDWSDRANNHEAIFIPSEANAPDFDADGVGPWPSVQPGKWEITLTKVSGTNQVYPAIAICGPVAADSSVRFDVSPVGCNGEVTVVVNETDNTADNQCNLTAGCTPAE
ncbi:MAG: S8 family serine peptidase, partial [Acidobacteriota bacterium]